LARALFGIGHIPTTTGSCFFELLWSSDTGVSEPIQRDLPLTQVKISFYDPHRSGPFLRALVV